MNTARLEETKGKNMIDNYISLDLETTGLHPKNDRILEIGAVKVVNGKETEVFSQLINPDTPISPIITQVTGINDEMVKDCPFVQDVLPDFIDFCDCEVILGHNLMFDYSFLTVNAVNMDLKFEKKGIDTLKIARKYLADLESRKLDYLCSYYGIEDKEHHRAFNDAAVTSRLYQKLSELFDNEEDNTFSPKILVYKTKKQSPITQKQKVYLIDLIKYHRIDFELDIDKMTKSDASRMIDKILSSYGRIL